MSHVHGGNTGEQHRGNREALAEFNKGEGLKRGSGAAAEAGLP